MISKPDWGNIFSLNTYKIILISIFLLVSISSFGQGLLLRGEKWQKFSLNDKQADFYVAPNGNDSWSGKLAAVNKANSDGPFKTIKKAQEAVRELKKKIYTPEEVPIDRRYIGSPHKYGNGRDILVLIRDGYYSLEEAIKFTPEDGGERVETNLPSGAFEYHKLKDYYVTYSAYPGEHPIISGGKIISKWKKEKKYWSANTENIDVKNLIVNGMEQTLARTPNSGYFTVPIASKSTSSFNFNPGEIKKWPDMDDNRIIMYLRWHQGINSIAKVDESNNIAYLKKPQDGIVVISPRYYVENIKALLDSPGEWFYERKSNKLFLIPPANLKNHNHSRIVVPILKNLISIEGERERPVRNLRLYGLTFEAAEKDSSAISIKYANKCEIVDSKISAVAGIGIDVGLGTYQLRILNNKIIRAIGGAIRVVGNPYPANWSDIIREVTITKNYIAKCGQTSVRASNTLYTTISHNEITDNLGRYPIYVGGWSNLEEAIDGGYRVEYNHIHHVQALADDSGVITSGGYTYNSVIRGNLIHDVKRGKFNDNVAIWFDNMSYGWTAEDNIFYALEQGDMKLCAANLIDNNYKNNYRIEIPKITPENIITGKPDFKYGNVEIISNESDTKQIYKTGEYIRIGTDIKNIGGTGVQDISLYINGSIVETIRTPIVKNNIRKVSFDYLFSQPGEHRIAIGSAHEIFVDVKGDTLAFFYDSLKITPKIIPVGDNILVKARIKRTNSNINKIEAKLYANNNVVSSKQINFGKSNYKNVEFEYVPVEGKYNFRIGNSNSEDVLVYPYESIDISNIEFAEYCAARAEPHKTYIDQENNKFRIETSGIDFYHGEDSYASIYIKNPIKGNFVATVKVTGFGKRTNEWFRAGLFVRNEMTKSFGTGDGSKGSVLMFVTPQRAGMNWDEFGDGCMHKANSENHPINYTYPIWIKLVRHGNSFSGYISYDGENWIVSRHTEALPGINEAVHLGIAAGAPDQLVYSVDFIDLKLNIEKSSWKEK